MRIQKKSLLKVPAIAFAILIFLLSQIPGEKLPPNVFDLQDKVLHLFAYFLFGLSLIIATAVVKNRTRAFLIVILIGFFYALLDELHQMFVPNRVCDITDWAADFLGVVISLVFLNKLRKWISNRINIY
ncbi:MAG: VanZ family protein [Ignavibacteria bacterium]|nr:VanZ family protein [Ignavibacteria bacterium]